MTNIYRIAKFYREMKKYNPILYHFLKQEKSLKLFAQNCKYQNSKASIISAFKWYKTIQGYNFWCYLHEKYINFKYQIKNEL